MSEFYEYCSICDNDLKEDEKKINEEKGSIYYPICNECLNKSVKKLIEIIETQSL